ncbi:60S acidic ribosomal protein P0 [Catenaria anguillulae PL171]|uniref:Large ribosomal subunit protein uL10 n=1 Tax=Catenaria anguillulae PL171 TaxID=765915 RepID=A0A1Y2HM56_9FUNG|nr:60S acidic ribosomal protein P0 [Catenaria anguillulae PL171]
MHNVRRKLRSEAAVLMGKNTMVRRALRVLIADNPNYEKILPHIKGNVGFIFTNSDLKTMRDQIIEDRVRAPAKAGALAPLDVTVPAGNTGMEPGKTSFFQALGIPTKITKGTVEITSDFPLIKAGSKVGPSEAALLNMMNISPFTYGLSVVQVYNDGNAFHPSVLDIDDETLLNHLVEGIRAVAAVSLAIGVPTAASVPHSLINGYKNVLAIALATDLSFPLADAVKDRINNPDAYAAAAPAASSAAPAAAAAAAPAAAEESEEEEDVDFDLFD